MVQHVSLSVLLQQIEWLEHENEDNFANAPLQILLLRSHNSCYLLVLNHLLMMKMREDEEDMTMSRGCFDFCFLLFVELMTTRHFLHQNREV